MSKIDPETVRFLLSERGTNVTFRRVTGQTASDYDPASGSTTGSASNDDENVKVVFLNYGEREITGNVERGDRRAIFSNFDNSGNNLSKTPQTGDQFVGEQSTVSIVDAETLKDGGTVVGYAAQVRE